MCNGTSTLALATLDKKCSFVNSGIVNMKGDYELKYRVFYDQVSCRWHDVMVMARKRLVVLVV